MEWIDTHAHLYLDQFDTDIDEVIARCKAHGVQRVVLPNIDTGTIEAVRMLCRRDPELFRPALGLHPCSVNANWQDELKIIRKTIDSDLDTFPGGRIWGIGEIGLDYYWDTTYRDEQIEALKIQAGWAKELNMPVILHCRDSFDDLYKVMEELNDERLRGVFHCFTGSKEAAEKVRSLGGFYIGLGGVLTFKKSQDLRDAVREIRLDGIVLETDAPYLTPAPNRGKRNESSYVRHVGEILAEVKGLTAAEVAERTSRNARALFGSDL